jgi:excisionase family DNA binding protein
MINKKLVEVENVSLEELVATITKSVLDGLEIRLAKLNEQRVQETLMTRTETAKYLKADISTIHNWTKKGKLKAYGLGNRVYYKKKRDR